MVQDRGRKSMKCRSLTSVSCLAASKGVFFEPRFGLSRSKYGI